MRLTFWVTEYEIKSLQYTTVYETTELERLLTNRPDKYGIHQQSHWIPLTGDWE